MNREQPLVFYIASTVFTLRKRAGSVKSELEIGDRTVDMAVQENVTVGMSVEYDR